MINKKMSAQTQKGSSDTQSMLVPTLVVGLIIAVGVAAWYMGKSSGKQPESMAPYQKPLPTVFADEPTSTPPFMGSSLQQKGWIEYDDKAFRVKILLPSTPMKKVQSVPITSTQTVGLTMYGNASSDNTFYGIGLANLPLTTDTSNTKLLLDGLASVLKGKPTNLQLSSSLTMYNGYDALDLSYVSDEGERYYVKERIIVINKRMIMLHASSKTPNPPDYNGFVESFQAY